ncbi:2OG-Fe(II) oxygenase [Pectobacterium polaris]|uniref:cyclophane-containing peptide 2OG-Fe(II) oxygenase YhhC n=1 Tax=Pectobacterium TaxID=122277 RepID=UPI000E74D091|nr:cyclophane-containing peptide 2OG-Fe(II) oxygenase YhhC [Pectobacterium polaris]MDE8755408.1 2OG-Fe(II) oxygenase [Pectobacterium polaris]RJL31490.1 2OG-Fe(II) oxygenase [Pectobacterium polaris]
MITTAWEKEINTSPYKYFSCSSGLPSEISDDILGWLETNAPWKRVNQSFYDQYEFSFYDAELPEKISFIKSDIFINELKSFLEKNFTVCLSNKVDIVAHKLISGDKIKIHNDYIEGQESHRILFHFNKEWNENNGGYFMVFSEDNPESLHAIIPPLHGNVQGFEISINSHHAVSKVYDMERYSILYSFYRKKHGH